jgi:hypothetical protein
MVASKISGTSSGEGDALSGGRLRIGWSATRFSPFLTRGLQYFKCLDLGHVRRDCMSTADRSDCCYRYGMEGHRVRYCPALARKCPVYEDLGLSASHRMGSLACKPSARKKKTRQKEGIAPRVAEKKEMVSDEVFPFPDTRTPVLQVPGFGSRTSGLYVDGRPVGLLLPIRHGRTSGQVLSGAST